MDQEQASRSQLSRALKVGVPAALGAGVIAATAVAAGPTEQTTTVTVNGSSSQQPTAIVMPPDKAKSLLTASTIGLSKFDAHRLRNPINVLAFTFGLGTNVVTQKGMPGVVSQKGASPLALNTFNFTENSSKNAAALVDLAAHGQSLEEVTLKVTSARQTLDYVMSHVKVSAIADKSAIVSVSMTFSKIQASFTSTKGGTMVSSWNTQKAPPIQTPFDIVSNAKG